MSILHCECRNGFTPQRLRSHGEALQNGRSCDSSADIIIYTDDIAVSSDALSYDKIVFNFSGCAPLKNSLALHLGIWLYNPKQSCMPSSVLTTQKVVISIANFQPQ